LSGIKYTVVQMYIIVGSAPSPQAIIQPSSNWLQCCITRRWWRFIYVEVS